MVMYGLVAVFGFSALSIFYVYQFRGNVRYASFSEYVRKGWPVFTPLNTMLYLFTQPRGQKAIMNMNDFPELNLLKENWQTIRDEALQLYQAQTFEATKKAGSAAYYDLGFRTFYKYGWSKFYLNWYGYTHESAKRSCPKTLEILRKIPSVNGAMFSLLPVGSQLTRHLDPCACSLRYHLGLATPNSDDCFINVDGNFYSWRDGEAFCFDETYMHFARNDSNEPRLILMCDVDRPTHTFGRIFNWFYKLLIKATVVPNDETDRRGLVNLIFSSLAPINARAKQLKATNRPMYLLVKNAVNLILLLLVVGLFAGAFYLVSRAIG